MCGRYCFFLFLLLTASLLVTAAGCDDNDDTYTNAGNLFLEEGPDSSAGGYSGLTLEECKILCDGAPDCRSISFREQQGRCWTKTKCGSASEPVMSRNNAWVTYYKCCRGKSSAGPSSAPPSKSSQQPSEDSLTRPSSAPVPEPRSSSFGMGTSDKEKKAGAIMRKLKSDVLWFRDEIETAYGARCETGTLTACHRSNFNDCSSTFPRQYCLGPDELIVAACGNGEDCNALWDKTSTAVSIPAALAPGPGANPVDEELIESACYTRLAEPYMVDKYRADEEYWARHGVAPSWTYFGAYNGMFRKVRAGKLYAAYSRCYNLMVLISLITMLFSMNCFITSMFT